LHLLQAGSRTLLTHLHFTVRAHRLEDVAAADAAAAVDPETLSDGGQSDAAESAAGSGVNNSDGGNSTRTLEAGEEGGKEWGMRLTPATSYGPEDPLSYLWDLCDADSFQAFMEQPEPDVPDDPLQLRGPNTLQIGHGVVAAVKPASPVEKAVHATYQAEPAATEATSTAMGDGAFPERCERAPPRT
jgi:hypothetical protein